MPSKTVVVGNLGGDPAIEEFIAKSGLRTTRAKFSIATKVPFDRDHTEWYSCVAFGKTAEAIGKFLRKGDRTWLEGYIKTSTYMKDGEKKYFPELHVEEMHLMGKQSGEGESQSRRSDIAENVEEDDVPF